MSSPDEHENEVRQVKRALRVLRALNGGIDGAVESDGVELEGLSFRVSGGDCLCTLRVSNHTGPMVAFVGAADLVECVLKVHREARGGQLRYREDRYRK